MFVNVSGVPVNSTSNSTLNLQSNSAAENIASLIILSIIIVIGIIGNSFVVTVVTMIPTMRTTTNILLLNVAVADIILLILTAIHVLLSKTVHLDQASSFMCKFIAPNTLSNVALLATGLTLTVLSVERYNALVKPMRISRRLTTDNVAYVVIVIWVVSMVMALPMLIYLDYDPRSPEGCSPGQNLDSLLISVGCIVFSMTIIPFLVIAFSYSQIICGLYFSNTIWSTNNPGISREDLVAKRKLVKLLVTITVVFFIAFVPYGVLQILKFSLNGKISPQELQNLKILTAVMMYLIPLHSSINPFLYTLQSQNYRDGFVVVARKIFCKGQGWSIDRGASTTREPAAVLFSRNQAVSI